VTAQASARLPAPNRQRVLAAYLVGLFAATVGVIVAQRTWFPGGQIPNWHVLLLLCALLLEGQLLRVRFYYRVQTEDLNFFEAALAVAFVAASPLLAVGLAAFATAATVVLHRIPPLKSAYNVLQWALATALGGLTYQALASGNSQELQGGALVAAMVVVICANQLMLATALKIAIGYPLGGERARTIRSIAAFRGVNAVASICLGVVLAAAFTRGDWVIAAAFFPLGLAHWASKAYAASRADQARLAGLQEATHTLSVSIDHEHAIETFIRTVHEAFEVRAVELILTRSGSWTSYSCDDTRGYEAADITSVETMTTLQNALSAVSVPVRVGSGQYAGALQDLLGQWRGRDCIASPLLSAEGRRLGLLFLFDRLGAEGFEDGELAVATALSGELVGFIERANLVEKLVEERTKLAQIVDQTSDGILTLSPDGRIRSWNKALEQITGYHSAEMIGTAHLGLLRISDEAGAEIRLDRWVELDDLPERVQVRTAAGETRWLSCSFARAVGTSDQEEILIAVARDVTSAHELERLKDDFVAVVSHELRTPLVPIKGWASMLLSRGDRMTADQRHDALESIHTQAQRLERLVLNILDASRIESGADTTATNVDVSVATARVVEEMMPSAGKRAIRLVGAHERHIALGQPVWVERALANLLANALKYGPSDSDVTLAVTTEENEIVVRVSDSGPGIPDGWTERIFERFERVPGSDTQTGTGLGLYITRQLVMAMGGTVSVDQSKENGTTFVMRLRASGNVPTPRPATPPPSQPLTIR
jgi:PAS domain S-box-containing protein